MENKYFTVFIITALVVFSHQCRASRQMLANTLSQYSAQSLAMASHAARTAATKAVQFGNALVSVMIAHPRMTCLCVAALLLAFPKVRGTLISTCWHGARKTGTFVRMSIIERIKAMLFTDVNERLDKTNLVLVDHTNRLDFIANVVQNLQEQMVVAQAQLGKLGIDLAGVKTNTEKLKGIEESLARLTSHDEKAFALLTEMQEQVRALQEAIAKFDGSNATIELIKKNQELMMKQVGDGLQTILMRMNVPQRVAGSGK